MVFGFKGICWVQQPAWKRAGTQPPVRLRLTLSRPGEVADCPQLSLLGFSGLGFGGLGFGGLGGKGLRV